MNKFLAPSVGGGGGGGGGVLSTFYVLIPDHLGEYQTNWKDTRPIGGIPDNLKEFLLIWDYSRPIRTIMK